MGNRVTTVSTLGTTVFAVLAAFLLLSLSPTPASAARFDDTRAGPPSFASSIIDIVNQRLCDRQEALSGRLPIQLVHPSKCKQTPPPVEEPTVEISADPMTIEEGESAELSWNSEHADSCEASGGWSGDKSLSGDETVSPDETTTYTITCENEEGSESDSVTVTVEEQEPETPTVDISADPMTITAGGSSELTWNSENTDSCTASNGWSGAKSVDGEQVVSPTTTATYAITCTGEGGTAQDSVTVTVNLVESDEATLTLVKNIVNNNTGTADADDWTLVADGPTDIFGVTGSTTVTNATVDVGTYTLSENSGPSGYTASQYSCVKNGGAAVSGNSITLADGDTATCTITNDDNAPETGTLVVRKVVVRDNGGDAATTTFSFQVNGGSATAFESDGENSVTVATGTYSVTEVAASGYTTTYDNCSNVVVSNGETETCTITNNDVAPEEDEPTLTFTANPLTVHENSLSDATTTLAWDSTDADSCTASGASEWTGTTTVDGTEIVTPTADTTYELDCTGPGGSVHKEVVIDFVPEEPEPTVDHLLISEVYYDVSNSTTTNVRGTDPANEWIEIYNPTNSAVSLTNWWVGDIATSSLDKIPDGTVIPAGGFLVITASSTTSSFWGSVPMLNLNGSIGNGLANTSDALFLLNANGATTTVDAISWGTNSTGFSPGMSPVGDGRSAARSSLNVDTDAATDWFNNASPNPGE